ncbi:hypothetical protein VTK56DRAFT_5302 [Thermocarpiscus australiensis]
MPPCLLRQRKKAMAAMMATPATAPAAIPAAAPAERPRPPESTALSGVGEEEGWSLVAVAVAAALVLFLVDSEILLVVVVMLLDPLLVLALVLLSLPSFSFDDEDVRLVLAPVGRRVRVMVLRTVSMSCRPSRLAASLSRAAWAGLNYHQP